MHKNIFLQKASDVYIATPLGKLESPVSLEETDKAATCFQKKLAEILKDYDKWDLIRLRDKRTDVLKLMKERLSTVLAETRLPANDVSLWQHSYSTASIFKAMLARHLLLKDYRADEKGDLVYHKERLAFLGVQWSEDDLLSRAVRPMDILGRRARLLEIKRKIKDKVELDYCLGNEIYQDKNGICFLVPDLDEDEEIRLAAQALLDDIEEILNDGRFFPGDVNYKILCREVGLQILGLSDLLKGKARVLRTGPRRPGWIGLWENPDRRREICSRCGLRPAELVEITSGSEGDEEKICSFCNCLAKEGNQIRGFCSPDIRKALLGRKKVHPMLTFETDKLVSGENGNSRVALVQGIFNLEPFLSGTAFSSILGRMPEDYNKNPGKADQSMKINSWDLLGNAVRKTWEEIRAGKTSDVSTDTLQQLFQDTFLGTKMDGRVPGVTKEEKLRNYIEKTVLTSPFPPVMKDYQKIALYALRQHPAPSRIARIWETTEKFCCKTVEWCEKNSVPHFPVSIDPGSFRILVPAAKAWDFLQGMYRAYYNAAGMVRHLLPFHLSACVFYYKAPLYVAIDAARRFAQLHTEAKGPELWELVEKEKVDNLWKLRWLDPLGREVKWKMPALLPNGDPERFFTWFWVEGTDHPISCEEIKEGQRAFIRPSTFDFEVLDTTTRRYDIRIDQEETGENGRPHIFFRKGGPRPYPLSALETWQELLPYLDECDPAQLTRLICLTGALHTEWAGCDEEVFKAQAADYLKICLRGKGDKLQAAAVSGALLDMFEWKHLIGKQA